MNETSAIEFVLHGKVEGLDITPRTIGLSLFNEFNQQVETFIGGSQKLKLDQVHVEIAQSSYALRALLPAVVLSSLEPDLKLMARQDVLGELDIKRAEVVQKWQARAKSNPDLSYEVRPEGGALPKVRVSWETDYQPTYHQEALDRFTAKGQEAWSDVPNAAKWVREARGA